MSASLDPIDYGIRREDNRLGHRAAVGLTGFFVLVISLPGLLREFSADSIRRAVATIGHWQDGTAVDRLRAVEKRVDDGAWTKPIRQQVQTALYRVFREGNRKVLVGRDGWLFHRPGIRALTGRGPVLGPTHSVAKDHTLKSWEGPIPVIQAFAAQLKERGIGLVLLPVPDKAGLQCREFANPPVFEFIDARNDSLKSWLDTHPLNSSHWRDVFRDWSEDLDRSLTGVADSVRIRSHPDALPAFEEVRQSGVTVILGQYFSRNAYELPRLATDTHPTPSELKRLALRIRATRALAVVFPPEPRSNEDGFGVKRTPIETIAAGDLIASLSLAGHTGMGMEKLSDVKTAVAVADPTSPIVLLGDSNVNMYDDPSLPFYMPGAGFGSWLSAYLGRSLHIIAINGGGATAVRREFAALPDDVVRAKKVVIWVIAERDLFMDPAVARENGVEWKRVVFNPNQSQPAATVPADAIVVDVTLKAKSALQDPAQANYPDAVYVAECTVDKVVTGTYAPSELAVVLWNFRNREVQPSAGYSPGQKLRLTLVPWDSKGDLTKTNRSDDFLRFDLPLLYAEKADPR